MEIRFNCFTWFYFYCHTLKLYRVGIRAKKNKRFSLAFGLKCDFTAIYVYICSWENEINKIIICIHWD